MDRLSDTARGSSLSDSRKLEALEVITGRDFNSAYGKNPVLQAGQYIEQAFDKLVDLYFAQLEFQTTYAELYGMLYMNADVDESGELFFDTKDVVGHFLKQYEADPVSGKEQIISFIENLEMTGMKKNIHYDTFRKELSDIGRDIAYALANMGDNTIKGIQTNDILIGERGNDILRGGYGNDIYVFNRGDGKDTINEMVIVYLMSAGGAGNAGGPAYIDEAGGIDWILFGEKIRPEDLRFSRDNWNLYITNLVTDDCITIVFLEKRGMTLYTEIVEMINCTEGKEMITCTEESGMTC